MAFTTIETTHGMTQEKWSANIFKEYLGEFPLTKLMGKSADSIIQVDENLVKGPGDAITISIIAELTGAGVTGLNRLKGNEEDMSYYNQRITIDEFRHGVSLKGKMSQKRIATKLRDDAKFSLKRWLMKKTEDDLINALSDTSSGRVQGRYLYGAANANYNATEATAKATIDGTADLMTSNILSIAKRKARFGTTIRMRPTSVMADKIVVAEKFFMFIHPLCARDLIANDTAFNNRQRDLTIGGMLNPPMITGSDFIGEWDGVLIYTSDRILLSAEGLAGIQIAHNLLLGAQAAAIVWGEHTTWEEDLDDYKHEHGFKVGEIRGIEKLVFDRATPEDHGVVHVYTAAIDD